MSTNAEMVNLHEKKLRWNQFFFLAKITLLLLLYIAKTEELFLFLSTHRKSHSAYIYCIDNEIFV